MPFDYDRMYVNHAVRCYNGAFDSTTERCHAAQAKCLAEIRTKEPEAHVTYFPAGGFYDAHIKGIVIGNAENCASRAEALEIAHRHIFKEKA